MKRLLFLLLFISCFANAQQEQQYSLYMANPYTLNPALAGTEEFIDFNAGFRYQWVGIDGSPVTVYLSGHGVVGKPMPHTRIAQTHRNWHGVGGYLYSDRTGPLSRTSLNISYSYNMTLTNTLRLSAGAFGGFKTISVNGEWWENIDDPSDNLFGSSGFSATNPDLSLGLWLYTDRFYVGMSGFQMIRGDVDFGALQGELEDNSTLNRHYFINSGVKLEMAYQIYFVPSVMIKMTPNSPISMDLNGKIDFKTKYWIGASYRHLDSFIGMIGTTISNSFDVSYGYDVTLSGLRNHSYGSHEIVLGYRLHRPKSPICPSKFW